MTGRLTERQRETLRAIGSYPGGTSLAALQRQIGAGRLGALTTVKSLIRRGLVVRQRDRYGYIRYGRTAKGAEL